MNDETLCQAQQDSEPCIHTATLTVPVRLCDEHKLQVATSVVPDMLAAALRDARAVSSRTLPPDAAHMVASAQAAPMPTTDPHSALVYFMANGGRVKIGFTKSLFSRISALSLREDAVLLLLHGGTDLERALHAKFGAHRVADSEWFELAPDVVHFIAAKGPKHRVGRAPRPTRAKAARKANRRAEPDLMQRRDERVRALYDELNARPEWTDIRDALVADKLAPKTISRSSCQRIRERVEMDARQQSARGTDNVRHLQTGS